MIQIENNRLMNLLKKLDTNKYYLAALLFCKLAEDKWLVEKNTFNVKHGYIHIKNIFETIDVLLRSMSDEDLIKGLGEDYLFVLVSSVYAHDLGMQDYYYEYLQYLNQSDSLDDDDLEEIRVNHSDIVAASITSLNDSDDINKFFGMNVKRVENLIENKDNVSIGEIKELILNKKRHIAVVCGHHNENLREVIIQLNLLCTEGKMCLTREEHDKIHLLTSLLQFGDALDMSKSRINQDNLISRTNSLKRVQMVNISELNLLKKMFLCYLIDDIQHEINNDEIKYIFKLSIPTQNKTQNHRYINECRDIYINRLRRKESDCVSSIEKFIKKRITLHMESENIEIDDNKKIIPQEFFELQAKDVQYETLDILLREKLNKLKQECQFLYAKLYSHTCNTFFGGIAICNNRDDERELEKLYFHDSEWEIDTSDDCILYTSNIFDLIKNNQNIRKYTIYGDICKKEDIKSEIYFVIIYNSRIIGFINLHFQEVLTDEEVEEKCTLYRQKFSSLGFDIIKFHQDVALKNFEKLINTFPFIESSFKEVLRQLYKKQYSHIEKYIDGISKVPISKIKELFNVQSLRDIDDEYYIKIHYQFLQWIYRNLLLKNLKNIAEIKVTLENSKNKSYIEIHFEIAGSPEILSNFYLEKACEYLKLMDVIAPNITRIKLIEYLFTFKSFFTLFGGKIIPTLKDDNTLNLNVLLPKKQIEKKSVCEN